MLHFLLSEHFHEAHSEKELASTADEDLVDHSHPDFDELIFDFAVGGSVLIVASL